MTPQLIALATGATLVRATLFADALSQAMGAYAIDTQARQASFLSEIGHETLGLALVRELWGPTEQQKRYERDFGSPWPTTSHEAALAKFDRNRLAFQLGNCNAGDGRLFCGHGLLQSTGRANAARLRDRLRKRFPALNVPDFEHDPERLCDPLWAALSAADYWDEHSINTYADAGDFDGVSDCINRGHKTLREGDAIGYPDRLARYEKALRALALA
jgi:putative chitinase